jgi:hypothetical protein
MVRYKSLCNLHPLCSRNHWSHGISIAASMFKFDLIAPIQIIEDVSIFWVNVLIFNFTSFQQDFSPRIS